jgi:SAM-dependent methyltransferase
MMLRGMRLSDVRLTALFLVSVVILAFEIEVMRVFSTTSWSNFGSMVISIGLLGFGLSGTLLTLFGEKLRAAPDSWLSSSAFALAPSLAIAHTLAQRVPFNPVLIATDPSQLWWIGLYYVLYGVPFFIGGIFIGTMFATLSGRMHSLYFWNMIGSGLGGLLVLMFMFLFPPGYLIYPLVGVAILPALLCCVRWSTEHDRFSVRIVEALICVAIGGLSLLLLVRFGGARVSDFKPESYARTYPDSKLVYQAWSPLGETRVFSSSYFHFAPGLSDAASVTLAHMPQNAFLGMYVDGNGPVGIMRRMSDAEKGYIDFLPMSAPYSLLSKPKVLLLRLGGGAGIQTALHHESRAVWVVESNPDLVHMLRDVPYFAAYTGDVLRDPRVHLVRSEVRAFAASTTQRFDLVEIGLIDSIGLSQAGGYSVEENYTYTEEALREYLKCLAPGGILSITVWDRLSPPRNVPKLLSTVTQALCGAGIRQPEKKVFVFNLLLSTATVLVKNGDFTARDIVKLSKYCQRMSFDVDYAPGVPVTATSFELILNEYKKLYGPAPTGGETADNSIPLLPNELYRDTMLWQFAGRQEELYARYIFDIRPATDDKPYYSGYLKPATLPRFALRLGEIPEEWGYILLLATFVQSLIFGLLVILVPVSTRWRELFRERRGTLGVILYYGCLGLGYMMAEIYLIQKFVFYLANPVYANSLVITILLVASGFGSVVSARFAARRWIVVAAACAGIAAMATFCLFGLTPLLNLTLGLPLVLKALLSIIFIAPLGLFLGVPFPTGLSALSESRKGIIPWAWGVNGALSVSGSVLTRILSTSLGFSTVLVIMAGLYLLAAAIFPLNALRQRIPKPSGLLAKAGGMRER